jgi:hypothetical protein
MNVLFNYNYVFLFTELPVSVLKIGKVEIFDRFFEKKFLSSRGGYPLCSLTTQSTQIGARRRGRFGAKMKKTQKT